MIKLVLMSVVIASIYIYVPMVVIQCALLTVLAVISVATVGILRMGADDEKNEWTKWRRDA